MKKERLPVHEAVSIGIIVKQLVEWFAGISLIPESTEPAEPLSYNQLRSAMKRLLILDSNQKPDG